MNSRGPEIIRGDKKEGRKKQDEEEGHLLTFTVYHFLSETNAQNALVTLKSGRCRHAWRGAL